MPRSTIALAALAITALSAPPITAATRCYPPQRYVLTATEVFDAKTGLTWQRQFDPSGRAWAGAKSFCTGGFRLPSVKELFTIVDGTRELPAIDLNVFPGTPGEIFWSSTPDLALASDAWAVRFHNGSVRTGPKASLYLVRCVR